MQETVILDEDDAVKRIGHRTFMLDENVWTESTYNGEKTVDIKFGSAAYMDILMRYPKIARILKLGEHIVFKVADKYIRVGPKGKETLTATEIKKLFGK